MTKSCIIDTNILLNNVDLSEYEKIFCPITVLEEVDKLKTSDSPVKSFKARQAVRHLQEIKAKMHYTTEFDDVTLPNGLIEGKNDNLILKHAIHVQKNIEPDAIMLTLDLNIIEKCRALGINVLDINDYQGKEIYKGYLRVELNDAKMAYLYSNLDKNIFDLQINQYLIVHDKDGNFTNILKWDGKTHKDIVCKKISTDHIGTLKPLDEVQMCAFDSLYTNDITCLFGKSGTGKTSLVLGYALQLLKNSKINKIYVLTTCKDLKGSEPIGFLPGTKDEKLLNDNIGMILTTKFGGIDAINQLIINEQLEVLPLSKIRGVEFSAMDCVIVTESQNINIYQMKTVLQRCKQGCKILIEGDMLEQKDVRDTEDCGMERMIEVFTGNEAFGCIKLKNNYRNPIAELADKM